MSIFWFLAATILSAGCAAGLGFFRFGKKRDPWANRRVMLKYVGIQIGETNAAGEFISAGELDTGLVVVTAAKDGWLYTTHRGKAGWFPQDYAVVLEEAPAYFAGVIREQPGQSWGWASRGVAWLTLGDRERAVADLTEAIRLNPSAWQHYWWRGTANWWRRQLAQAEADFAQVIRLAPAVAEGYTGRASVTNLKGEFDRTLADAEAALKLNPADATAWNMRGSAWLGKFEFDRALADFDEVIRLDPNYAPAYANRGGVWLGKGDRTRALSELDAAVERDRESPLSLIARGRLRHWFEDYRGAVADFTAALRIDPDSAEAFVGRGFARAKLNRHVLALADFGMAARRDPNSPHPMLGNAVVGAARKDYAQAWSELEKARQLAPDDHDVLNHLAWFQATCPDARYRDGRRAVINATRACEKAGGRAEALLDTLAAAHAEAGEFGRAVQIQRQVLASGVIPAGVRAKAQARLAGYERGEPYRE